ncbi:hypothetical protein OPV22_019905 [Ensete ventricosum]|uniref:Uncharacterized protein n=1 Tax=Ensete ventricosum TaxID=4639 RepID=A0AAV8QHG6_ENSVE|nr:hypothetical protein OPV22_019905 [Ensete ventricosum]
MTILLPRLQDIMVGINLRPGNHPMAFDSAETEASIKLLLLLRSLQPAVTDLFGGSDAESQSIITFLLAKLFPGCAKPNPT